MKKGVFVLFFLFVGFLFLDGTNVGASGPKVPPFELNSLRGEKFTEEALSGKVTLVVFWASWCGTCQEELPKVHDLQERMKGKPFQAVAIGFKDSEANIRKYVGSHPKLFSFPVLYDAGDQVARRFGANFTPTLFLLDKKGELVMAVSGPGMIESARFHAALERIL